MSIKKVKSILYVEDESEIREALSDVLEEYCDEIYIAENGQEGIELYKEHIPDIVVSDIKMPIKNGIEMAQEIKELNKDAHIVFTTAFSDTEFFQEAINLQVDGYIIKPIDLDLLENKLLAIIDDLYIKREFSIQYQMLNEIASLQNNMVIIISDEPKILYANQNFLDFLSLSDIDEFYSNFQCICQFFMIHDGYYHTDGYIKYDWTVEAEKLDDSKRVVLMLDMQHLVPKSFLLSVKYIEESKHTIVSFTEITNISLEKSILENKANKDQLTQIYNRTYLHEHMSNLSATLKDDEKIHFMIFDIDFFKKINDTYGHQVGDIVLKEFTSVISAHIRSSDLFARWGGEEFVLLLSDTTLEGATKVAEHLRDRIEKNKFVDDIKVTCSIGVTEGSKKDTEEALFQRADEALYKAKETGRNRVEVYQ
jgi:diguanylate cyclase (GGDEF)-like protein